MQGNFVKLLFWGFWFWGEFLAVLEYVARAVVLMCTKATCRCRIGCQGTRRGFIHGRCGRAYQARESDMTLTLQIAALIADEGLTFK
eukprot:3134764-Amphidinium_carterae.1